jgi:PAS domain S-box-containing protein
MIHWSDGERRFEELADNAPILMWRADGSMACDWVNRAWLEFTGRSLEQELGSGWMDAMHPSDRSDCIDAYKAAISRREQFLLTFRLKRADGAFRWVSGNVRPFPDENGGVSSFWGAFTDVDDMVKANEALRSAVQERAEAIAQRDHLLREVQHRVRNNLQLILSIIDMQRRVDTASRPALDMVAGRVRSIAKAQALLLDPIGAATLDLNEFIPSLAQEIIGHPSAHFATLGEPMLLPLSRAVPLGLMINELLTSLRQSDSRDFRIAVAVDGNDTLIEIAGDGTALPGEPSTFVHRLASQAGARVLTDDKRAMVTIRMTPAV